MDKKYAIIGGDARIVHLAQMISKEEKVYVYGQEKWQKQNEKTYENIVFCETLEFAIENAQTIVSSIPFTKDGVNIYAPFSKEDIKIESLFELIHNKVLIAGSISNEIIENLENRQVKVIDLMKQEDLTILNTIATAEGAISDIILNTPINIHKSEILILGFGRVAKELAKKLQGLDAKVTCAARKEKDFAWMEALGFSSMNINKLDDKIKKYDVIINTVPQLILDKEKLKYVNKDVLLLDLASKPGGIDQKECERLGLNFVWSLAIPGKVSPITSAKYIKRTIDNLREIM